MNIFPKISPDIIVQGLWCGGGMDGDGASQGSSSKSEFDTTQNHYCLRVMKTWGLGDQSSAAVEKFDVSPKTFCEVEMIMVLSVKDTRKTSLSGFELYRYLCKSSKKTVSDFKNHDRCFSENFTCFPVKHQITPIYGHDYSIKSLTLVAKVFGDSYRANYSFNAWVFIESVEKCFIFKIYWAWIECRLLKCFNF